MGKGANLGEFEQTVLFTLARFREPVTGRAVYKELMNATGRDLSIASVHVTLTRLEAKGLLDESVGPGPEGVGKTVKHFALNALGGRALKESREHWERLWHGARLHPALKKK
jgi:DNA-binding PadR family transcriptional regulator